MNTSFVEFLIKYMRQKTQILKRPATSWKDGIRFPAWVEF